MADQFTFIIFIVLFVLGITLAFSMGANDETLTALVGAGAFKFKIALLMGGIATGLGMIFFSQGVGKTVGADILGPGIKYTIFMLLAVLISSIMWLIVGSFFGLPLSTTHSTIGAIFGVLITYSIFKRNIDPTSAFNYSKLNNVVLSWFISPLFGFLITYILFKLIIKLYLKGKKGLNQIEKSEKNFTWCLVIAVIFAEVWVGANSAECIGIFYGLYNNGSLTFVQYRLSIVLCGISVFLGIFFVGRFVIKNLASQMTDARPSDGFIVQTSTALILMVCTLLALPISHTHVIVFSILGLNVAQKKEVDYKAMGKMALFWVLTFPITGILACFIYCGFLVFGFY